MKNIILATTVEVTVEYNTDEAAIERVIVHVPEASAFRHLGGPAPARASLKLIAEWPWEEFDFDPPGHERSYDVRGADPDVDEPITLRVAAPTPAAAITLAQARYAEESGGVLAATSVQFAG